MKHNILLLIKTESGDEYQFRLNKPLSEKDLEIFIQDNLPDEEYGVTIFDYKFIDLNLLETFDF